MIAGLLSVSRCVADIDPQQKLVIAHNVNTIHVPVALQKFGLGGGV
jgi:hypothetical protein